MKNFDEEEKKEPAWYEKTSDGSAWYETPETFKKEESPKSSDEDGEKGTEKREPEKAPEAERAKKEFVADLPPEKGQKETDETDEEEGEYEAEGNAEEYSDEYLYEENSDGESDDDSDEINPLFPDWEEYGKIYLPDPPPVLAVKKIRDEDSYIEKFFEKTADERERKIKSKKKRSVWCFFGFILLGAFSAFFFGEVDFIYGIEAGIMAFILAALAIYFFFDKKSDSEGSKGFFLIEPYAVKKKYGASQTKWQERANSGLIFYHIDHGTEYEAETEMIYTEKQLDEFIEAFLKGRIVVACKRKNFGNDKALICEPEASEEE